MLAFSFMYLVKYQLVVKDNNQSMMQFLCKRKKKSLKFSLKVVFKLKRVSYLHFSWWQGCDGSVLIDSTKGNTAEKDSPANVILRGYEIIDQAKQAIENQCPGVVSCADIIAMAARDAVHWVGVIEHFLPVSPHFK